MLRKCISLLTIWGLLLSGCHVSTDERVLMRYSSAQRPLVRKAPFNGQYRLYTIGSGSPTTRTSTPAMARALSKGDAVGFARDNLGRLVAVVKSEQLPLADLEVPSAPSIGDYTWTVQPDPGQVDVTKTVVLVLVVVAVTGTVLVVAAVVSFNHSIKGSLVLFRGMK